MTRIISSNKNVNADTLNSLLGLTGGQTEFATGGSYIVTTTPTNFSYISRGAQTGSSSKTGTGVGLTYDSDNLPIGGTITGLSEGLSSGGVRGTPPTSVNLRVEDISISATNLPSTTFGADLLA